MRRRAFLAAAGAAATALAGCSRDRSAAEGSYDVGMSSARFRPGTIAVAPGTTIVWRNTSGVAHTVTAVASALPAGAAFFASGGFDDEPSARDAWLQRSGGAIEPGETYRHRFDEPGAYRYVCIPHEQSGMVGTVRVTADASRTPRATGENGTVETAGSEAGTTDVAGAFGRE